MTAGPATQHYLRFWNLVADDSETETSSSWVLPVRRGDEAATLKVLKPGSDERNAALLLRYFDGDGAVRLLASDAHALLMERATGSRSLKAMTLSGQDTAAAEILAHVVEKLHARRDQPPPAELTPLKQWFSALFARESQVPILRRCAAAARRLLTSERDIRPLHGDLHHDNVLDGGPRGWLAIDPKGVIGERAYDFANLIGNPWPHGEIVHDPERMQRVSAIYAAGSGLDVERIRAFAFAHAGLAASWDMDDGDPTYRLKCAELFSAAIGES
jgi:streptomycin 6-kinase